MIGETEVIARLFTLGNALSYIVVLDEQIVGTRKRVLEKDQVAITIDYSAILILAFGALALLRVAHPATESDGCAIHREYDESN